MSIFALVASVAMLPSGHSNGPLLGSAGLRVPASSSAWRASSGQVARWWSEGDQEFWAVGASSAQSETTIRFSTRILDPNPSQSLDLPDGRGLWIVQLRTQPMPEMMPVLERGLRRVGFLPDQAFIFQGPGERAEALRSVPFVRWVGPLTSDLRMPTELRAWTLRRSSGSLQVVLQVPFRTQASLSEGTQAVRNVGSKAQIIGSNLLQADLNPAQLTTLLNGPSVVWAEPETPKSSDMVLVRQSTGAAQLDLDRNIRGQGVIGEVMDGNVRATHVDLSSNGRSVTFRTTFGGNQDHGSSTTGIVFGDGTGNINGLGLLPLGTAYFSDYDTMGNRYTHMQGLPTVGGVFQSNSWGNAHTMSYSAITQELDQAILDSGVLVSHSQGNINSNSSRPQAWAKNVVSVGAIESNGTLIRTDDTISNACFGPAADGRIKPDLSHFYSGVFCPTGTNNTAYTSSFGGTSSATAVISGHFGLLYQLWSLGEWGNSATAPTVFANKLKWYTAKALMTNAAASYDFSGSTGITRIRQGWGTPDITNLRGDRDSLFWIDGTDSLSNLQSRTIRLLVTPSSGPLRFTLCYPDPAALPNATIATINRLDLYATSPSGVTYAGNAGLLTGNESTPGSTPDNVSTLEQIWLSNPEPGIWTIRIEAPLVIQDVDTVAPGVQTPFGFIASGVAMNFAPYRSSWFGETSSTGSHNSLPRSDQDALTLQSSGGPMELIIRGESPYQRLADLRLQLETSANVNDIRQFIEWFNFTSGRWVVAQSNGVSLTDTVILGSVPTAQESNSARWIDPDSGEVRVRIRWQRASGSGPYSVRIDQTRWFLAP